MRPYFARTLTAVKGGSLDEYTLDELSAQTGFDRRVIRSFIEQGLMRGPDSLGRYARYTQAHLLRLLAIKELKENKGMQVAEIRQALMVMSEAELRSLTGQGKPSAVQAADSEAASAKSALEYIRTINYKIDEAELESHQKVDLSALFQFQLGPPNEQPDIVRVVAAVDPPPKQAVSQSRVESYHHAAGATPIEQLVRELEKIVDPTRIRKQAKSESWHRITITPDLELSVRGINTADQLARLERIADCLREILMGGAS